MRPPPLYAHTHPLIASVWRHYLRDTLGRFFPAPIRSPSPCPVRHKFHRPDHKCGPAVRCVSALALPGPAATGPCLCVPIIQIASLPVVPCTVTPPVVPRSHVLRHLTLVCACVCVFVSWALSNTPSPEATMVRGAFFFVHSRHFALDISSSFPPPPSPFFLLYSPELQLISFS